VRQQANELVKNGVRITSPIHALKSEASYPSFLNEPGEVLRSLMLQYIYRDDQAVAIKIESKLLNDEWKDFIQKLEMDKTMKKSTWNGGSLRNDELTIELLKDFMKKSSEEYENKMERKVERIEGRIEVGIQMSKLLISQSLEGLEHIRAIARTKSLRKLPFSSLLT
jgi:hypothetical protein